MPHDPALVAETRAWFRNAAKLYPWPGTPLETILERLPAEIHRTREVSWNVLKQLATTSYTSRDFYRANLA